MYVSLLKNVEFSEPSSPGFVISCLGYSVPFELLQLISPLIIESSPGQSRLGRLSMNRFMEEKFHTLLVGCR